MAHDLFPAFLESKREYARLVDFWRSEIWPTIPSAARKGWLTPWLTPLDPELEEGNPIFSAWNHHRKIGLQIIQVPPHQNGSELSRWVEWFGDGIEDPAAVQTLVVVCVLTQQNLRLIKTWMQEWLELGRIVDFADTFEIATSTSYTEELLQASPY
jgi:hypothetical protein